MLLRIGSSQPFYNRPWKRGRTHVMAVEAGGAPLDYGVWVENKEFYFKAIQAGAGGDYTHIERLINDVIEL